MRSFTKSLGRFSWALSLFGLSGLAELLGSRRSRRTGAATAVFDSATGTFEQRFAQPFRTIFQLGDRLFGGMLDLLFENKPPGCGCGAQSAAGPGPGWPDPGGPDPGFPGGGADIFGGQGGYSAAQPPGFEGPWPGAPGGASSASPGPSPHGGLR